MLYLGQSFSKEDCTIEDIRLSHSNITEEGFINLCSGVTKKNSLTRLEVARSQISLEGIKKLQKASILLGLSALDLSNNLIDNSTLSLLGVIMRST